MIEKGRAKNFFALGLVFWMYGREPEGEIRRIYQQFAKKPEFGEANVQAVPLAMLFKMVVAIIKKDPLALLCQQDDCERCGEIRQQVVRQQ